MNSLSELWIRRRIELNQSMMYDYEYYVRVRVEAERTVELEQFLRE